MDLSSTTFDTTNALSGMFLWVIFGYLTVLINCDIQRILRNSPWCLHLAGLTAFFFLFTVLDGNNKGHIGTVWLKTLFIYVLFVLMTKSKWYFVVPVLGLLLLDQTLKKDLAIRAAAAGEAEADAAGIEAKRARQGKITRFINVAIIVLISLGALHYMILQKLEYRERFSFYKFFIAVKECKKNAPDYAKLGHGGRKKGA